MKAAQKKTLDRIDRAIGVLEEGRVVHFQLTHQRYNQLRNGWLEAAFAGDDDAGKPNMLYLGFELMVTAELYACLQDQFDKFSVFMEYPGLERDRIDLYVDASVDGAELRGYIENKMYYGKNEADYEKDFKKLKEMTTTDPGAVAVMLHFELYGNKNRPNEATMDSLAASLNKNIYWTDTKIFGDPDGIHFYRVAFGYQ